MNELLTPTGALHGNDRRRDLIFLTGFMGSGKSTVGPILANTLGFDFFDVDRTIEERAGKRVVEIFRDHGEGYFRTIERGVLRTVLGRTACVISLGGGTIADDENFRLIHESGILVYLELAEEEIFKRVERRHDRPLLHDDAGNILSREMLKERIKKLLAARTPYYQAADLIVPSHDRNVGKTVDTIVAGLRRLL